MVSIEFISIALVGLIYLIVLYWRLNKIVPIRIEKSRISDIDCSHEDCDNKAGFYIKLDANEPDELIKGEITDEPVCRRCGDKEFDQFYDFRQKHQPTVLLAYAGGDKKLALNIGYVCNEIDDPKHWSEEE